MEERILDGAFSIFEGPIHDDKGTLRVERGQRLSDEEILEMTWLCEGDTEG